MPTRRNPARPSPEGYTTPTLDPEHAAHPRTRWADAIARALPTGEPVGRGFFGQVYRVRVNGQDLAVKIPVVANLRGEPWTPEKLRPYFLHEAGIANLLDTVPEVQATGAVPEVVFVEGLEDVLPEDVAAAGFDFAMVRVYGRIPDPADLTPAAVRRLEAGLLATEAAGLEVDDDLLILVDPEGTLFIGDLGWWRVKEQGWSSRDTFPTRIGDLLERALEPLGASVAVLQAVRGVQVAHVRPAYVERGVDAEWVEILTERAEDRPGSAAFILRGARSDVEAILHRDPLGFPVKPSVRQAVRALHAALGPYRDAAVQERLDKGEDKFAAEVAAEFDTFARAAASKPRRSL